MNVKLMQKYLMTEICSERRKSRKNNYKMKEKCRKVNEKQNRI